jgi:penicillin G amidase
MRLRWRKTWAVMAAAGLLLGSAATTPVAAAPAATYPVDGLDQPVQLLVDKWGVPHIYARSAADAFLAQGFNAARDRLFQIDLWLRNGTGRLSEAFGPKFAEKDRAARLFLYRGDIQKEWESYGAEGKQAATRFAGGVNAYLDWLKTNPDALPEQFRKLGHQPRRWTPEDVVRIRMHGLSYNLQSEFERAGIACAGDLADDRVRVKLEPAHSPVVPAGLDLCAIPWDVLGTYDLAKSEADFSGDEVRLAEPPVAEGISVEGSNNWVIGGSRTTTGRPILANDPHRSVSAPSTRYIQHLNAPGLDVIGAGEVWAPGVSIGHNGTASFGLTVFQIDQEDLYVYQLDPANPNRYRYRDGWEDIRTVTEEIPVAGEQPRAVQLPFTRHGPVIKVDTERNLAYAVRNVYLEPGMSPYYGSMRYQRAKNFAEFSEAIKHWGGPPLNHVYADTSGAIGWAAGGKAPKRVGEGYDGLLPVPGDGRYEWDGFYPGSALPRSHNPRQGFIATANEFNLPSGFPKDIEFGYEWAERSRFQRITEVLTAKPKSSLADSMKLQNDQLSVVARAVVAQLASLSSSDPDTAAALTLLRGWDAVEHKDSAQAALFEVWLITNLGPAFSRAVLPPATAEQIAFPDHQVLVEAIQQPEKWFPGPDPSAQRNKVLLDSLKAAYGKVSGLLGKDPATWKWGSLHQTLFRHPAASAMDAETAKRWNVGPFPRGGSWNTVNISVFSPFNYEQWAGASFRMAVDVGNWDASMAVNTPGQSGNPASPHYRDLADKWRNGEYFPLSYSKQAVLANTEQTILLTPKR